MRVLQQHPIAGACSFVFMIVLLGTLAIRAALAANGSVSYTYDALGRVSSISYDTGVCVLYTYDPNGNRLSETITVGSGGTSVWNTGVWGCFKWG